MLAAPLRGPIAGDNDVVTLHLELLHAAAMKLTHHVVEELSDGLFSDDRWGRGKKADPVLVPQLQERGVAHLPGRGVECLIEGHNPRQRSLRLRCRVRREG